ncbi:uncharacterized protein [Dendropsophus ebraccatus]|uniref:uncharacterized protein n=1 Tax=Dendropsophus ebraccatus TaxID=150705 RepID=UPI00383142FF
MVRAAVPVLVVLLLLPAVMAEGQDDVTLWLEPCSPEFSFYVLHDGFYTPINDDTANLKMDNSSNGCSVTFITDATYIICRNDITVVYPFVQDPIFQNITHRWIGCDVQLTTSEEPRIRANPISLELRIWASSTSEQPGNGAGPTSEPGNRAGPTSAEPGNRAGQKCDPKNKAGGDMCGLSIGSVLGIIFGITGFVFLIFVVIYNCSKILDFIENRQCCAICGDRALSTPDEHSREEESPLNNGEQGAPTTKDPCVTEDSSV